MGRGDDVDVEETDIRQSRLEVIGSAAAGVAHDLNNQFTLILNHLAVSDLASANDAVSRCVALTSGLLAWCRGESAPLKPTDLASAVRRFAAHAGIPEHVRLNIEIAEDLAPVLGDETDIERALDNLFRNACAAMKTTGKIRIVVRSGEIDVEDSGPGIAPENLHRIFEPFFSTRGSGLGLAIVRDIMRRHGGSVTVQSTPGAGAKFTLRFRAAKGSAAVQPVQR
jgi:two-component system sensor histidine kinase HydH